MFAKKLVFVAFLVCVFHDHPTQGFIGRLMNRVQQQWMLSWQRMRDQQIRPRKIAELQLQQQLPTYVQVCFNHFFGNRVLQRNLYDNKMKI